MELTKAQTQNLVLALKSYRHAKKQHETSQKSLNEKLAKLKEMCHGSGSEEQIMASVNQLLAQAYLEAPDGGFEP